MNSLRFRCELLKVMPGYQWTVHQTSRPESYQAMAEANMQERLEAHRKAEAERKMEEEAAAERKREELEKRKHAEELAKFRELKAKFEPKEGPNASDA